MRERRSEQPPTLRQCLDSVRAALRDNGICEWQIEADILLRRVVEVGRADFLSLVYGGEDRLTHAQALRLRASIARRLDGEPLAYIVGRREFYGLDLQVNEHTLIPRQETELLVELALEYLSNRGEEHRTPTLVDVGTGSGAVALAIAANSERINVIGVDISRSALNVAAGNAARLTSAQGSPLSDSVTFIQADLLTAVTGPVDIIVSNPPYIPSGLMEDLPAEVRREPFAALDGGIDGLEHFRRLATQANYSLAPGGVMIVELMPERMDAAMGLAVPAIPNIAAIYSRRDLMGNRRALVVEMGEDGAGHSARTRKPLF